VEDPGVLGGILGQRVVDSPDGASPETPRIIERALDLVSEHDLRRDVDLPPAFDGLVRLAFLPQEAARGQEGPILRFAPEAQKRIIDPELFLRVAGDRLVDRGISAAGQRPGEIPANRYDDEGLDPGIEEGRLVEFSVEDALRFRMRGGQVANNPLLEIIRGGQAEEKLRGSLAARRLPSPGIELLENGFLVSSSGNQKPVRRRQRKTR
jgi:hypothetical protein